jgi:aminoglycoside phosphotransferase (APT) family kinase protein
VTNAPNERAAQDAAANLPPTDEQLWWSVRETVRSVLLPQLGDPWARLAAIHLVGLADFARGRAGVDPWPARLAELRTALHLDASSDPAAVLDTASKVLVERRPERDAVRAILVRQLDEAMAASAPMVGTFRGALPEGDRPPHTPPFHQPVDLATSGGAALGPGATILASWLEQRLERPVGIASITRLAEGHSRAMFAVTLEGGTRYVLRMEQGGVFGTSSAEEFRVMRSLYEAGYPVARVRWHESDSAVLGQPFFLMDFIEADRSATPTASTGRAFIELLHDLHELDWQARGIEFDLVPASAADATPMQVERWRNVYRRSTPVAVPLLEEAAAWLIDRAPPLERVHVVHGDAGPGNFVHRDGRIVAVTDFEFCHLGDPAEDWSFCASMRGYRTMERTAWIDAYNEILGFELDEAGWDYWEAFNLFKGACANLTTLRVFADGSNPAPNMLAVGTALQQTFLRRLVDLTA